MSSNKAVSFNDDSFRRHHRDSSRVKITARFRPANHPAAGGVQGPTDQEVDASAGDEGRKFVAGLGVVAGGQIVVFGGRPHQGALGDEVGFGQATEVEVPVLLLVSGSRAERHQIARLVLADTPWFHLRGEAGLVEAEESGL